MKYRLLILFLPGRADIVELLLDAGANPCLHATTANLTPLHKAVSNGHLEVGSPFYDVFTNNGH